MPLLALAASALAADAPEVGGIVRPELVVDLANDREVVVPGETGPQPGEDGVEIHTWARVWARGRFDRGDAWFLEGRLQHHVLSGADAEAWWELGLGETGWDGKVAGPLRLRTGALIERWGKLDLLPVTDVLNPRDLRSGLTTPAEWQRTPVPMASWQVDGGPIRSETTLIPFSTGDRLWLRETDWSYVREGMVSDQLRDVRTWPGETALLLQGFVDAAATGLEELGPSLRRGLDGAVNGKNLPEALLYNGEAAQRFELRARNLDLAVMGGWLRSRQPEAELPPLMRDLLREERLPANAELAELQAALAGGPMDVTWPRTAVLGADGSGLVGPLQVRGEAMWQSARVVRQRYGGASATPSLGVGLGLDWVRGSSFQVTLEGRWLHLPDPPAGLLFARRDQVQLAGGVRASLFAERLSLQLGGSYDATFDEGLFKPALGWRAGDHLLLETGALVLKGRTPAPDDLADAFVYEGGLLSYFQQNDALTFAVTLIR